MPPAATIADLLELAAAAPPAARVELLLRAERAARGAREQQQVADAWAAANDHGAAQRCITAALANADCGVWDHRRAAALRAQVGDPVGARRALDDFEARMVAPRPPATEDGRLPDPPRPEGLQWRLLAEGHAELGDLDTARRCLATGLVHASTAEDLYSLAKAHVGLFGDEATARELLVRAESVASGQRDRHGGHDVGARYTVAVAWHELFADLERCRASLRAAAAAADGVDALLTVARAWGNVGDDPTGTEVRAVLDRARAAATTAELWLAIAEHERELGQRDERVRSALHAARALAAGDAEHHRVNALQRRWLGDAVGPTGWTPAQLATAGGSAFGFAVAAGALFDWLRAQVTDAQLATIAAADCGNDDAEHLAAVRELRDEGVVPVPLRWHPREVLSLQQWQEGNAVDHVARAFCTTVLCLEQLHAEHGGSGGIESTLAVLLESCVCLGRDAIARLTGLLAALLTAPADHDTRERAAVALALLLAAAWLDPRDARLEPLAVHLLELERTLARDGYAHPEHGFLLGATHHVLCVEVWRRLVHELLAAVPAGSGALAELRARLEVAGGG
jgi:hypothetical protein